MKTCQPECLTLGRARLLAGSSGGLPRERTEELHCLQRGPVEALSAAESLSPPTRRPPPTPPRPQVSGHLPLPGSSQPAAQRDDQTENVVFAQQHWAETGSERKGGTLSGHRGPAEGVESVREPAGECGCYGAEERREKKERGS